jgi:chorismate mutase
MQPTVAGLSSCFLAAWLTLGCGHPATEQECQEIAERVAKLELQSSPVGRDPDTAQDQMERVRNWVKEGQLKSCVGKRITDSAMRCVRSAKKAEEITDTCFR